MAQTYFNGLLAKDVLSYTKANKESVGRLFTQAKHKFEVGLIPIADLKDTRSNYDKAVADEIAAINDLNDNFEKLSEITGIRYYDLDSVKPTFPLLSPQPATIESWVKAAEQQNFDLLAARYDTIAARENIKVQNAGHLPTLTAQGGYSYGYNSNNNGVGFGRNKQASAGVELAMPIFQGGGVVAAAKQADYQYQVKLYDQEKTHRSIVSNTRQTYLGILSNISKIKADQQAIKSAKSSLRATQASYTVGTRTMADVLTAQTQLYDSQKSFAQDEYNYIIQLLTLKMLTGSLAVDDLQQLSTWLEKPTAADNKPINRPLPKPHRSEGSKKSPVKNTPATNAPVTVLAEEEVQQITSDNQGAETNSITSQQQQ